MKESSAAIHVQVPVDVATFLLNEKRADIHRIESRLKVAITLIPNPHLETPNYSINRLRQDDLSGDVLQASYKLVEKPTEEKPLTAAQEIQKATRAQAVVQGVTPAQPAPMKVEEAKPSFFSRLFGWLNKPAKEEQPKTQSAANKPRNRPRPERGERAEGGAKRRERGARGERNEGGRERNEPRGAQKPAQTEVTAKPQEPRPPKQPRPPRVTEEKPLLETPLAAAVEQTEEGGAREGGRRRGRRGGQRERQRRENTPQNAEAPSTNTEAVDTAQTAIATDVAPARLKPSEYIAYPDGYTPPVKPVEQIIMPTVQQDLIAAIPSVPVTKNAPVATIASSGEGLVQIETDPIKLNTVANVEPAKPTQPASRRRVRQHEVYVENEPLVQIETQH